MYIEKIGFFTHLLDYVTIFLRLTLPKRQFRYADAFHAPRRAPHAPDNESILDGRRVKISQPEISLVPIFAYLGARDRCIGILF
jgi:hypothetical protein